VYARLAFVVAGLISSVPIGDAQVITATVNGNVTDPSKLGVQNAEVQVRNEETNIVTKAVTDHTGGYEAPLLPPGSYEITVAATGFKTFRKTNVVLTVDATVRVDAHLEIGATSDQVIVAADPVILQTDQTDLSTSVSQAMIRSMPNVDRNPLQPVVLTPGLIPRPGFYNYNNTPVGEDSRRQYSDFSINGTRPGGVSILLDGAPNNSNAFNEIAVLPSADSIGELKVTTNDYSAEFGRAGSGVIQFYTKPGTNFYHASLYDFWRNSALNANSFGNNAFDVKKGVFNAHQFGGTLAGPINLPDGVYRGKDRTFFFFSYEGIRRSEDASGFLTVPTALERQGDFSQTRQQVAGGALVPVEIYNPLPNGSSLTAAGNGVQRTQFQDGGILNKIPAAVLNPVSLNLIKAFPLPNITPLDANGGRNFFYSGSNRYNTNQTILRLDHRVNDTNKLMFRYTHDWSRETPPNPYQSTLPSAWPGMPVTQNNPTATITYLWTQSPTSLWEFRGNVTRINLVEKPEGGFHVNLADLGFAPSMIATSFLADYPQIDGYPIGHGGFTVRNNHTTNTSATAAYTKVLTKLTVKLGGEYRLLLNNFYQPNLPGFGFTPLTSFTTACSGNGCPPVPGSRAQGSALAAMLIGAMDGNQGFGEYSTGDPAQAYSMRYYALYSQNTWKANQRLTVNLGLRWDFAGSLYERYNRLSQFEFQEDNITGTPGRYTFSGRDGNGRGRNDPLYRSFGPRVGLAYRPFDKTVIRTGYGICYDPISGTGSGTLGFGADGFRALAFMRVRPDSGPFDLLDVMARPFDDAYSGGGKTLGPNSDDPGFLGYNAIAVQRKQGGVPSIQQWNFTIERELPRKVHFQTSYVGSEGSHLLVQFYAINGDNSIPENLLQQWRNTYIATGVNPYYDRVPNPFYVAPPGVPLIGSGDPNLSGPLILRGLLAKPYPAYGGVSLGYQRFGSSSYNALQVVVNRSFLQGFELGGHYVFSKSIDSTRDNSAGAGNDGAPGNGSFSLTNLKLDRSVSRFDVPHRLVGYGTVELPFGRGKKFLARSRTGDRLLGGWQFSGITQWQSGLALGISSPDGFGRPDLIGDPVLPAEYRCFGPKSCKLPDGNTVFVPNGRMLFFNPLAYRNRVAQFGPNAGSNAGMYTSDLYWYGTSPRYDSRLRGWPIINTDASAERRFRVTETVTLQFRADVANVFNRKDFSEGAIDTNFGSTYLPANPADPVQTARAGLSNSATFGTLDIRGTRVSPRYFQFALKLLF
jgi:hypothetical protein